MPDRRAAARAGDRIGGPPHRPDADRRRRRGRLLDADACGRIRGAAALRRGARLHGALRGGVAAPRAPGRRRTGADARAALARARRARGAPSRAAAPVAARDPCGRAARLRSAARRHPHARGLLERKVGAAGGPAAEARRARLDSLTAAIGAHDPERVIARGYAVVDDRDGNLITTAEAARAARDVRLFFADADVDADDLREEMIETQATRARPAASRRSSAGWTPAKPACARHSTSARRAVSSSSSARASSTPSVRAYRSCAWMSSSRGSSSGRPRTHEPAGRDRAAAAAASRAMSSSGCSATCPATSRASRPTSTCAATARRASARTSPTTRPTRTSCRRPAPVQPLEGSWTVGVVLRPRRHARPLAAPGGARGERALPPLGVRVGGARPRAAPERMALHEALGREPRPVTSSSRCGSASRRRSSRSSAAFSATRR